MTLRDVAAIRAVVLIVAVAAPDDACPEPRAHGGARTIHDRQGDDR